MELKEFPLTFDEILKISKRLNLDEAYNELISNAFNLRQHKGKPNKDDLFRNISYLNKFIEPKADELFKSKGNMVLIK